MTDTQTQHLHRQLEHTSIKKEFRDGNLSFILLQFSRPTLNDQLPMILSYLPLKCRFSVLYFICRDDNFSTANICKRKVQTSFHLPLISFHFNLTRDLWEIQRFFLVACEKCARSSHLISYDAAGGCGVMIKRKQRKYDKFNSNSRTFFVPFICFASFHSFASFSVDLI